MLRVINASWQVEPVSNALVGKSGRNVASSPAPGPPLRPPDVPSRPAMLSESQLVDRGGDARTSVNPTDYWNGPGGFRLLPIRVPGGGITRALLIPRRASYPRG